MLPGLRTLAIASTLSALISPAAFAGGIQAKVEGPMKDGHTYLVRTYHCQQPAAMQFTAFAEGVVNGKRQTLPLTLKSRTDGVFTFDRAWPREGRWVVRLDMGGDLSLVATLAGNGRVKDSELRWDGGGRELCEQKLAALAK